MVRDRLQAKPEKRGYVLLMVVVLVFVLGLTGFGLFGIASQETRQAIYRQHSSEAFGLADGAIERARAKFLVDLAWRDGWSAETAGAGSYDLAIADTSVTGHEHAVRLTADGYVDQAVRRVEVLADIPPAAFGLTILIMGSADVNGNLCLEGDSHINGDGDFGPHDAHLHCGGQYTEGFTLTPPPVYTEPDSFPGLTYYFVRGNREGSDAYARIYDGDGIDVTTALGDSLLDVTSFKSSTHTYQFAFDSGELIDRYFNQETGVFKRLGADRSVVVNFGEAPLTSADGIAALEFQGGEEALSSTIINTRFIGVADSQRVDSIHWIGGLTTVKQVLWEPAAGIALIVHDFQKSGGSLVTIGTEGWPALVYVTQDVVDLNSNFELRGCLICLRDWNSSGGPHLVFDPGFLDDGPGFFDGDWDWGVSGVMQVICWRELAADGA